METTISGEGFIEYGVWGEGKKWWLLYSWGIMWAVSPRHSKERGKVPLYALRKSLQPSVNLSKPTLHKPLETFCEARVSTVNFL